MRLILAFLFISHTVQAAELKFTEALKSALSDNEEIQIQKYEEESAEVKKLGSEYGFLPQFSLSASQQRTGVPVLDLQSFGINTNLNLYRGGADLAGYHSAVQSLAESKFKSRSTLLSMEGDLIETLLDVVEDKDEVRILISSFQDQTRNLELAERKYRGGILSLEQVDKIRIDRANSEAELRDDDVKLEDASSKLKTRLKLGDVEAIWPWREKLLNSSFVSKLSKRLNEIPPEEKPDYRAAEARYAAAEYATRQARGQTLPSLDLQFSVLSEHQLGKNGSDQSYSVALNIPLFDSLSDYSKYQVQKRAELEESYRLQLLKKQIVAEHETLVKDFTLSLQTALDREKNLESSRRLLHSSLHRFEIGRIQADELSLDQQRVTQAELLSSRGWRSVHSVLARLIHSRGLSVLETFE